MNKLLIRILILLALSGLFVIILLKTRHPFGKDNSSFASEPKDAITRIDLSENGRRLILEKKGETWMINGKYEARKSGIFFIVRILKEIRIKSPVSSRIV